MGTGTFTFHIATDIGTKTGFWYVGGSLEATNQEILDGINAITGDSANCGRGFVGAPSAIGEHECRFGFSQVVSSVWELVGDGAGTYLFNELPLGFEVLSATLHIDCASTFSPSSTFEISQSVFDSLPITLISSGGSVEKTFPYITVPTKLDLLQQSPGVKAIFTGEFDFANFKDLKIIGTYQYSEFPFTLDPPTGSEVEANTPNNDNDGDLITITSDPEDPDHLLLDQLTISIACGTIIIKTQTETLFEFWIPSTCSGAGIQTITATGNGVQFSGSVALGTLDILLTNGSGLYVITPGNLHDVLYSSLRDGTTRNVKKPNPFIKSGFIGG